ncbi:unnamed protein product [Arctia plantaginis]|uniref:Uncharacterized protein n=1 Tax=Arctia plantaginis TaxID=874455 RepID=A0A8S0Z9C9_ARCPL|nr:unnamed protein product [Arctia plantaginis]
MAKEKCKKNEDELERRRIARREKYKRIKSDPEKYAIERAKKKEAYLKRKIEQKVKNINEMSPREQRAQRKRWRENSKRYLKKKAKERQIKEVTIISQVLKGRGKINDKEVSDPLCEENTKEEINNEINHRTFQRKNKALKLKHATEKKEMTLLIKKYKNRCRILTKILNKMKQNKAYTGSEENTAISTQVPIETSSCHDGTQKTTSEQVILKFAGNMKRRPSLELRKKCLKQKIKQGSDSVQELIRKFYEDDINSRIGAGKKQYLRETFPSLKLVTWNYQESGHGKGAPDGVGAVVKRTADNEVKCWRDVGDFSSFLAVVRENVKNVEIKVVEEHEIIEKELLLPKDISPFKGTLSVHQVIWHSGSEFIEFRKLSCFLCMAKIWEHENKHMQLHKMYKSVVESVVQNIKVIPPSKRITVLNDVSIQYFNRLNP